MTRFHRLIYAGLALLVVTFVAVLVVGLTGRVGDAESEAGNATDAAQDTSAALEDAQGAVGTLAQQVRRLGGEPVLTPSDVPDAVVPPSDGATGSSGERGATGPRGPRGFTGDGGIGKTGASGSDGTNGSDGIGRPGARGATGAAGEDSTVAGPTGAAGQDSTVPGPRGEQGPPGPAGPPGPQGTANPGAYSCANGEYVTGLRIGDNGAVTLMCATPTLTPGPPA